MRCEHYRLVFVKGLPPCHWLCPSVQTNAVISNSTSSSAKVLKRSAFAVSMSFETWSRPAQCEAVVTKWTLQNPCFILISMSLKWRTIATILSLMCYQIHDVYILRLVPNLDNHRSPFTLNKMLPDFYERHSWWLCDYSWTKSFHSHSGWSLLMT